MRLLVLYLCLFVHFANSDHAGPCDPGYVDDVNGNCITVANRTGSYSEGHRTCAKARAVMYDVRNAFDNNNVLNYGRQGNKDPNGLVRLSLTCTNSNVTSCSWDSGRNISPGGYSNFYAGAPNITAGACVNLNLKNGLWYSADCMTNISYGCQVPSYGTSVRPCGDLDSDYFQGQCYFSVISENYDDARHKCQNRCGDLPDITSDGVNIFINSLAARNNSNTYSMIGFKTTCNTEYCFDSWPDYRNINYAHFGIHDLNLGLCVSMALKDDMVKKTYWISTPCNTTVPYTYICSKGLFTNCDIPTTTIPPTLAPTQCSSSPYLEGSGDLYSPGYPRNSQPNSCEYLISEQRTSSLVAMINFTDLSLDANSYIKLYDSILDAPPFATLTGTNSPQTIYSSTNILKIVFETTGTGNNYFHGIYSGAPAPTPTISTTPQLACLFMLDWAYLGNPMTEYAAITYQNELNFLNSVVSTLFNDPSIAFEAQLGVNGYTSTADSIIGSLENNFNDFFIDESILFPDSSFSLGVCDDAITSVNGYQFPSSVRNTSCLVFVSGQSEPSCRLSGNNFKTMITATLQPNGEALYNTHEVPISASLSHLDEVNLVNAIKSLTLGN